MSDPAAKKERSGDLGAYVSSSVDMVLVPAQTAVQQRCQIAPYASPLGLGRDRKQASRFLPKCFCVAGSTKDGTASESLPLSAFVRPWRGGGNSSAGVLYRMEGLMQVSIVDNNLEVLFIIRGPWLGLAFCGCLETWTKQKACRHIQ